MYHQSLIKRPVVSSALRAIVSTAHLQTAKDLLLKRPEAVSPNEFKQADKMKKTIKLLLADDHPVVRKGIMSCLARHVHLKIIGEANDGSEALQKVRELNPDIVLMDIDMPGISGLSVTELLRKENPKVKVLVLSMHNQPEYVMRIVQSGARGYVLKGAPTDDLVKAIEMVNGGESFFSPDVARLALNQLIQGSGGATKNELTNREREVLTLIAEGLSNKEIAMRLGVGVRTVETHRERVMRKLDIHSVAGLTRYAISKGWVTVDSDRKE